MQTIIKPDYYLSHIYSEQYSIMNDPKIFRNYIKSKKIKNLPKYMYLNKYLTPESTQIVNIFAEHVSSIYIDYNFKNFTLNLSTSSPTSSIKLNFPLSSCSISLSYTYISYPIHPLLRSLLNCPLALI